MKANRKYIKDEEAVSPVIGVILMVAITVILAAVIAAFVFGMGSSLKKQYVVAATASQNANDITVVFNGGPDADQIKMLNASIGGSSFDMDFDGNISVGSVAIDHDGTGGNNDHVIVVATFTDGSEQLILDTYV